MAVVVFDPTGFVAQFPEFASLSTEVLTGCFSQATLFCNNTGASVVTDLSTRTQLLWLLTAHLAKLFYGTNCEAPSDLVGRVALAKEGTVHVSADIGPPSGSAAWYNQTRYGAMYWAATVRYRTMRYVPAQSPMMNAQGPTPAIWPWGRW